MISSKLKRSLIGLTVLNIFFLLISYFLIIFTIMMFDNASGDGTFLDRIMFFASCALPILAIIAIVMSWYHYNKGNTAKILKFAYLPLRALGVLIITWLIAQWTCDLTFNCIS